jgi:hypothetical protein
MDDEFKFVDDWLSNGKNVDKIPEMPQISKTPDFFVEGEGLIELKTLTTISADNIKGKIKDAFGQIKEYKGNFSEYSSQAETVIINGQGAGYTKELAQDVINKVTGNYGGNLPGKIKIILGDGSVFE